MLRSNKKNLHPVMFGIYEDIIYHHGAGFRFPTSRIDKHNLGILKKSYLIMHDKLPNRIKKILVPNKFFFKKNMEISEQVYTSILHNPDFYRFFIE